MRPRAVLGLALLAAAVVLAGCLVHTGPGDEELAATGSPGPTDSSEAADASPALPPAPYSAGGEPVHTTIERQGTFSAAETCLPAGCFTGAYERNVDITDELPVGVPAHVNVTLTYDEDTLNYVAPALDVDGAEVYSYRFTSAASQNIVWLEATVGRLDPDDRVRAQVEAYSPDDGQSEYEMTITIEAHPTLVAERVPVVVDVPPEADGFRLGPTGEARAGFDAMVWDPSDAFLGHRSVDVAPGGPTHVTVELGPDAPPGRYVVLVTDVEVERLHRHDPGDEHHHHAVRALPLNNVSEASMEPLGLRYTAGAALTVNPGRTVSWTPEAPVAPIQAGLSAEPLGGVSVNPGTLSGELSSPSAPVVTVDGAGYLLGFLDYLWLSPVGHEDLDQGTYEGSFHNGGASPVEVRHVFGFYER